MGRVVAAVGQSHVLFNRDGVEQQADAVFDGYKKIGELVRAAKPDVLIMISGDHMLNITTEIQVPLAVAVGDSHMPLGDTGCPREPFAGHREFAEGFVRYATDQGFDLAKLEEEGFEPDHGYCIPAMFINPKRDIPTVIINVNTNMDPIPSPQRCHQLGTKLRRYIDEERPHDERVAVVATGGLSHWLMVENDGDINEDWDRKVLEMFAEGHAADLANETVAEITATAGNGGVEINYWLLMAATVPDAKGSTLFYEPIYSWKTGMGAVVMNV